MKVLIAPQFNEAMSQLDKSLTAEVYQLYHLLTRMTRDELMASPMVTKISDTLFTLRTSFTRVFCTFTADNSLLLVGVDQVRYPSFETPKPVEREITLYGHQGDPKVYIDTQDGNTIYTFGGRPLAYVEGDNIYGFNGRHLGWYEDGIVWDHKGRRVGFTSSSCPVFTKFAPFKGFKQFKPFKSFKNFPPFKPFKQSYGKSGQDLLEFMGQGAK